MSSRCSIETCNKPSAVLCYSCGQNLCNQHYKEHDEKINSEINFLSEQIKNLSNRYELLDIKKLRNDAQDKLFKWRNDSHQFIERLYQQKQDELNINLFKPQKDIDQIRSKINELNRRQNTTHEDIYQSIQTIKFIDQQIKDIETKGIQIDTQPLSFQENHSIELNRIMIYSIFQIHIELSIVQDKKV